MQLKPRGRSMVGVKLPRNVDHVSTSHEPSGRHQVCLRMRKAVADDENICSRSGRLAICDEQDPIHLLSVPLPPARFPNRHPGA
jgi:hypothetical protein